MATLYKVFKEEYLSLGYMERVIDNEISNGDYYFPYHAVFRPKVWILKGCYRPILIDESEKNLYKIVLNQSPVASVETFKLKTVTYGTFRAPILATRTLKALSEDEKKRFPRTSSLVLNDTYTDNI
ncbi:uncharacterized protein NPIL_13501 [Nephila pilipes]|uniref:Uncharacterized protein n=1 Tax=Nephila pilipes TaxID=299642 RepID=A0A8X6UT57_NEPPI|nr:uncharacterized protein NPIL_13501 [Nephila pilipes]